MMSKKSPQLRFEGFTDDWEERKLKDIAQFNPKTVLPDEFEYVDLESVVGTEMISHRTESKDQAPSRAQRLAQKGDVFYQTVRPYQMNNYLYDLPYDNYVFSTGYAQMRPNIDSYFLLNSVQNKQFVQHVLDRSTGTSYPAINSSDLSNIEINVPSKLAEQQKIGAFFKQLDDTIALHQRKLDLLKEQKKGYLQKMFPKNGAKVPELRFAGFADDWEDRKLGDFLKTPEKVKAHIQSKDDLMTLKLNLGGLESGSNRETLELGSTIYYKRKAGQFIYGKQNFFNGSMAIIPIDLDGKATSGDVPSLDVVGILSEYLYVYVSRGDYWKSKESEASGTGSKRIHEKTLQGFDIKVPSTQNEQRKIGSFFKQLDATIALHQRKLDLLKEQKKGFLQKMFV